MFRIHSAALLFGSLFICNLSTANELNIPRVNNSITIDGDINEQLWQQAASIELNEIAWPETQDKAPVQTTVRYMENGDTLFIAFEAQDADPEAIRAYFRGRDNLWLDDLVGVKLDPYNDHRLAFQFFVNPLGEQMDSTENVIAGTESNSWDGIWDSAGKITEQGFTVEMAIPMRNFNFNPSEEKQTWAVEFVRFYPRDERLRLTHLKIDRNNSCWVCQMAPVSGFAGVEQGKSLSLTPTLVLGQGQERDLPDSTEWQKNDIQDVGLDVKWGITSDIFLNASVNPDFSQVEADAAQLGVNNNFTLFYPEKRPFFLENHDLFNTNDDVVYTRNIGAMDYGAKLTGRTGKHAFGLFFTNDENTTFLVPGNLSSDVAEMDQESKNTALRYRYDASNDLSIGWLGTFRTSDDYHNYVNSVDVRYKLTEQDTIKAQFMTSDSQYPIWLQDGFCDDDGCQPAENKTCEFGNCYTSEQALRLGDGSAFTDRAYGIRYEHNEKHWFTYASYWDKGADFRADLGFMRQADYRRALAGGGYIWYGDNSNWWSQIELSGDWDIMHNQNGELIEREIELYLNIDGPMMSYMRFGCRRNEHVGNRWDASQLSIDNNSDLFEQDNCIFYGEMQPVSGLIVSAEADIGERIDYANNRLGDNLYTFVGGQYNFNRHLMGSMDYVYNRLKADGADVYVAHQIDSRISYNLDQRNAIRFSLIYTDIDFNRANYLYETPDDRFKAVATQLLYSYKINPQTVIYAGYSDGAYADDEVKHITRDNRSIFTKFSYAWLY